MFTLQLGVGIASLTKLASVIPSVLHQLSVTHWQSGMNYDNTTICGLFISLVLYTGMNYDNTAICGLFLN